MNKKALQSYTEMLMGFGGFFKWRKEHYTGIQVTCILPLCDFEQI